MRRSRAIRLFIFGNVVFLGLGLAQSSAVADSPTAYLHQRGYIHFLSDGGVIDGVRATMNISPVNNAPYACENWGVAEDDVNVQVVTGVVKCDPATGGLDHGCSITGALVSFSETYTPASGYDCHFYAGVDTYVDHVYSARQQSGTNDLWGVIDGNFVASLSGFQPSSEYGAVLAELSHQVPTSCTSSYSGAADYQTIQRYNSSSGGTWYTLENASKFTRNYFDDGSVTNTPTCFFNLTDYSSSFVDIWH